MSFSLNELSIKKDSPPDSEGVNELERKVRRGQFYPSKGNDLELENLPVS